MEKHDVNINKQSRPNGIQCRKKLALRAPLLVLGVCPLGTLWYPSGDPRAQAPLVGVCPLGTLWSPLVYWDTPLYLCSKQNLGCVLNSNKLLQEKTIYGIYMTFLKTRSVNFVGTPPQVRDIRGGGAQDRQSVWFCTYGHPEFKFYAALRAASP